MTAGEILHEELMNEAVIGSVIVVGTRIKIVDHEAYQSAMLRAMERYRSQSAGILKEVENIMERWNLCRDNDHEAIEAIDSLLKQYGHLSFWV